MTPRMLLLPGGTSIGAVALAHAGIHKIVELHAESRDAAAVGSHTAQPHTVVTIRDPRLVPPSTLRTSTLTPREAFPPTDFPQLAPFIDDPALFDGVDLVIATSGSSGSPRWVGLSVEALLASAAATHDALDGPGRWILALPTHHIAGAMVLARAVASELPPQIVDTSTGFAPELLLRSIRGATADPAVPGYLSLVPTQLRACLDSPFDEVTVGLARLSAVLVGGASCPDDLVERATDHGIRLVRTYGMTETSGGCVYDGQPMKDVSVSSDPEGHLVIDSPTLLTRYLDDGPERDRRSQPFVTNDCGNVDPTGKVSVTGRADHVIISGGLNIVPAPIQATVENLDHVAECVVLGMPDPTWGQVVTAVVVPVGRLDAVHAEELGPALRERAAAVVGRERAPRRWVFVDALPRVGIGKVDVAALRDQLATNATAGPTSGLTNVKEWRR